MLACLPATPRLGLPLDLRLGVAGMLRLERAALVVVALREAAHRAFERLRGEAVMLPEQMTGMRASIDSAP